MESERDPFIRGKFKAAGHVFIFPEITPLKEEVPAVPPEVSETSVIPFSDKLKAVGIFPSATTSTFLKGEEITPAVKSDPFSIEKMKGDLNKAGVDTSSEPLSSAQLKRIRLEEQPSKIVILGGKPILVKPLPKIYIDDEPKK